MHEEEKMQGRVIMQAEGAGQNSPVKQETSVEEEEESLFKADAVNKEEEEEMRRSILVDTVEEMAQSVFDDTQCSQQLSVSCDGRTKLRSSCRW